MRKASGRQIRDAFERMVARLATGAAGPGSARVLEILTAREPVLRPRSRPHGDSTLRSAKVGQGGGRTELARSDNFEGVVRDDVPALIAFQRPARRCARRQLRDHASAMFVLIHARRLVRRLSSAMIQGDQMPVYSPVAATIPQLAAHPIGVERTGVEDGARGHPVASCGRLLPAADVHAAAPREAAPSQPRLRSPRTAPNVAARSCSRSAAAGSARTRIDRSRSARPQTAGSGSVRPLLQSPRSHYPVLHQARTVFGEWIRRAGVLPPSWSAIGRHSARQWRCPVRRSTAAMLLRVQPILSRALQLGTQRLDSGIHLACPRSREVGTPVYGSPLKSHQCCER